jgi:release factor glutamine methyltransferase
MKPSPNTIGNLLEEGRTALAKAPFAPSRREAALLLSHILGIGEASVLARTEQVVEQESARKFHALLRRRLRGEPVAYLFGAREFYGRTFEVDRRVLIPRPETEHLIEAVLSLNLPVAPRILDIGTGSGCIAITLALEIPTAHIVASDLSLQALAVLQSNCRRHGVGESMMVVAGDLVAALRLGQFDLVVSNPPYIDPEQAKGLSIEVHGFEPHLALFAPEHGASILNRLVAALGNLQDGVHVVLEIGHDQAASLQRIAASTPRLELVDLLKDYSGISRTAVLRQKPTS